MTPSCHLCAGVSILRIASAVNQYLWIANMQVHTTANYSEFHGQKYVKSDMYEMILVRNFLQLAVKFKFSNAQLKHVVRTCDWNVFDVKELSAVELGKYTLACKNDTLGFWFYLNLAETSDCTDNFHLFSEYRFAYYNDTQ